MGSKKIDLNKAQSVLEENCTNILTIAEWADAMGYSRSHFSRINKIKFGICPKESLKKYRLTLIKKEIKQDSEAKAYKIAVNIGYLNEKCLAKFLNYNFNSNIESLKSEILK